MDAVKFVEERRRMYMLGCIKHAINDYNTKAEAVVAEVEQWSKEHPRKTRQSVFLEQWPNCMINDDGVVGMCPRNVDKNYACNLLLLAGCKDCRHEFWMQEVE